MNDALLDKEQKVLLISRVIEAFPLSSLPVFHFLQILIPQLNDEYK